MRILRPIMSLPIFRGVAFLLAALGLVKLSTSTLAALDNPRGFLAVLALAVRNGQRVNMFRMAAALAYRTIFGLIPVIVVSLVVVGSFATPEDIRHNVSRLLEFAGLNEIVLPGAEGAAGAGGAAGAAADAAAQSIQQERLDQWITRLVDRVRSIPFGTIGSIGVIALIYAAISMLVEVEQAFNHVCRAPTGRSWARRVTQYWALLTLGPIFLFASFYVQEVFTAMLAQLTDNRLLSGVANELLTVAGYLITSAIMMLLLVIVYTTVPNTRVRIGPAIIGALLAAVLFEAGKRGFVYYVKSSTSYSQLYGALALLPLFMLWVYVTWVIVLMGLQLAYALQTYTVLKTQNLRLSLMDPGEISAPKIVDPAFVVPVAAAVARAFALGNGQPIERARIASAVGLDDATTADLIDRLVETGTLHRVSRGQGGDEGYALARPPERIRITELLHTAKSLTADPSRRREADDAVLALGKLDRARLAAVDGQTLADYLSLGNGPTPGYGAPADMAGTVAGGAGGAAQAGAGDSAPRIGPNPSVAGSHG